MIQATDLTRRYHDVTAVQDVSFTIDQGEIVGLLGRNGAGKTTIMKMLTGYLEPTAGSVTVDGLDIGGHRRDVQARLGYLPENCPLYPEMTVLDYLEYVATLHGIPEGDRPGRLRGALERTSLVDRARRRIATLSRGYRQRVGVAQAILHRPQILILDEPTNGLDPTQVLEMRGLITDLARESTVILSTHILQEVEAVCDRVIIIQDGKKVVDGRLEELRAARRLRIETDLAPETALPLLQGIASVQQAKSHGQSGERFTYTISGPDDPTLLSTACARALLEKEAHIFALHPERRDLETIFGEITTARGNVQ